MRIALSALILLLFLMPAPVLAWAPEGHQIVASIAARELTLAAMLNGILK